MDRRSFIKLTAAGTLVGLSSHQVIAGLTAPISRPRFKALAFDGFPILDPRPVFALCETLFPCKGAALAASWKTRQFEYAWLRVVGHHYADFWQVTGDALTYAAHETKIDLTEDKRQRLMHAYLQLETWPDVLPVLRRFRDEGVTLAFLSNFSPDMLAAVVKSAGLDGLVTRSISTDSARTYKPSPEAYQLGIDTLELSREEILFVAFGGWDAAGAKWFGYPTFWVNRLGQPAEELSVHPDGIGSDLLDLEAFVFAARS
ncbi:MAG: haloacid dehalogenase type II [Opitutaceae bacterium]|jgi:2-haloacid dehalogenase